MPPKPDAVVQCWFNWYCRYSLRKHFHRVHLFGDVPFDSSRSTLYLSNHSSFWDPIALNFVIHHFRRQPSYCMSDEQQVRKHPFFRKVGAFSVDRTRPRDGLRAVKYASGLLNDSPCAVVVYPQGKIEPNDKRPITFESGVQRIRKFAPAAQIVLVAVRYEFWLNQRPELLIDLSIFAGESLTDMEMQLAGRLDLLVEAGREYRNGSRILLQGRRAIGGDR